MWSGLIGAVLLEQNDELQLHHRYLQVEVMAELVAPAGATDPRRSHARPSQPQAIHCAVERHEC
jgi:hypothetical protein